MKRAIKITIILLIVPMMVALTFVGVAFAVTAGVKLQPEKLIDYGKSIVIFDDEGNKIENASLTAKRKSVNLNELNEDTLNAFIASEDRDFYEHRGLNYKRMLKALYKNVASFSFKEGASTISQQLIKNTHLSGDKTIARKLKEIKLTKQLEKRYSKDEILEMYLNTIYFGHNCYGLQSAANFYFDKNAEELTLEESAAIVGLLTSPNNYSPFKAPEKCLARRNIVLKCMLDCGFIDEMRYGEAVQSPLEAKQTNGTERFSDYLSALFDELQNLDFDPYGGITEYKIYTYLNPTLQILAENAQFESDGAIVIENQSNGISAFRSTIGQAKRQIGSTAKPLFVYAPSFNEGKLHAFTQICDEPVDFGGYSPENYDKKYRGNVSVAECIKQSLNVPAVKALNALGMDNAEKYANKMGVQLESEEKNLSLALGGMKHGLTLKELCDCYSVFPHGGTYTPSRFIKIILDKEGNVVYRPNEQSTEVFEEGTCSLINEILCETAKSGTARKLNDLGMDVACKTGTCGNKEGNSDAYAISYTGDYCIGVWLGDKNNVKLPITGGNQCCKITRELLKEIYSNASPTPLEKTKGTQTVALDREEYENNGKIVLADDCSPKLNRLNVKCLNRFLPSQKSDRFSLPTIAKPKIFVNDNSISIELCQTKYYSYIIKRQNGDDNTIIYDGVWKEKINDTPDGGVYVYSVTPYFDDGKTIHQGKTITLPQIIIQSGDKQAEKDRLPDIVYKDWFNQ